LPEAAAARCGEWIWSYAGKGLGRADLIVFGDGDLLALNPFRGIPIVTPATFVQGVTR
jgi:hypothetical protein